MFRYRPLLSLAALATLALPVSAQQEPPPPAPVNLAPPADAVAATVNGQAIPEIAVFRALQQARPADRDELRQEVVNFLIENALIDQYLDQLKVTVDAKDLDTQVEKAKAEIKNVYKELATFYKMLYLTEADLRAQVWQTMRWEKFINQYAPEKALKEYFDANKAMFDGSQMRAKHILLSAKPGDAAAAEQAKAKLAAIKKAVEEKVAKGLAEAGKLDNLETQKLKMKLLQEVFAEAAFKESACPTKANGGELGWFGRTGGRVAEPFAQAAFKLKPWEMSDPVPTEFGYHLILAVDAKAGVERKFEDLKDVVRDVYAERMRQVIVQQMKPQAKIVVNPVPK